MSSSADEQQRKREQGRTSKSVVAVGRSIVQHMKTYVEPFVLFTLAATMMPTAAGAAAAALMMGTAHWAVFTPTTSAAGAEATAAGAVTPAGASTATVTAIAG